MIPPTQPPSKPSALIRFFSNPIVGVTASIFSVVGVPLAIYLFLAAKEAPRLTYLVHPVRSILVSAGPSSQLSVTLGGKQLTSDVSAAQVAFWNGGGRSIRPTNVLRPFVIKVSNHIPILEARIRKTSRSVVHLELDRARLDHGELGVTCNILERNDGGIIQIVYAGTPKTPIVAEVVVEGQGAVHALQFGGTIRSASEQYSRVVWESRFQGWLFLAVGALMGVVWGITRVLERRSGRKTTRHPALPELVMSLVMVCAGIYFLAKAQTPGPPFGF